MRIRVTFEAEVPDDLKGVDIQYLLSDALINFEQVRTDGGRRTVREVVEQLLTRDIDTPGHGARVERKTREREARILLAKELHSPVLSAEVRILCPSCGEGRETSCRCGWVPGMPLGE